MGFVRVQPGRGAYVCEPTGPQRAFLRYSADHRFAVAEIMQVRISLEVLGAGLAALHAKAATLRELEKHLKAHRAAHASVDRHPLIATDEDFHGCLMRAAGNQVLISHYELLAPQLREFRARTLALPDVPGRSAGSHQHILDAVRSGDSRAASAAVLDHLLVLYQEVEAAASSHGKSHGKKDERASVDLRDIVTGVDRLR
jgi:GntR family transcriptional repressor for pyruvate dehydrogenase complex